MNVRPPNGATCANTHNHTNRNGELTMNPKSKCPETCLLRRIMNGGQLRKNLVIKCEASDARCCIADALKHGKDLTDEARDRLNEIVNG